MLLKEIKVNDADSKLNINREAQANSESLILIVSDLSIRLFSDDLKTMHYE